MDGEKVAKVLKVLVDLGADGFTDSLETLMSINPESYPSFHARVLEAVKRGEYRVVDVAESEGIVFKDTEGNTYYALVNLVPYERKLIYTFEVDSQKFALVHPLSALSLRERLSVMDITDPEDYERRLKEAGGGEDSLHVEGYSYDIYTLLVPLVAFKNPEYFFEKYTRKLRRSIDSLRNLGMRDIRVITLSRSEHRNLPRHLPSLDFLSSEVLAFTGITYIKGYPFASFFALSWARAAATYEMLKGHTQNLDEIHIFQGPETEGEERSAGRFHRPESVPKPVPYREIARFYNAELLDYEYDGKPLGRWKEEDPTLYGEAIKTFAHVEAQLKRWKSVAFPHTTIVGRYL
ncbi:MAG: hypothetical protein GXO29_07720 [Thermotogae bacterium]|nr:hypothetical protein [Thermotogota bacterium]